jgi:pSer/pThr/pTyr-binding forkhead associated (FHA) protein
MSPFILSVLKYVLLVLLYFFVFRAIRSAVADVGGRRSRAPEPRAAAPPSRGRRAPTSVLVHGGEGGRPSTVQLSGPTDVGRAPSCTITVGDTYVSHQHARFFSRDGSWFVEDLGSTNGTYLNDRRISEPAEVHAGDVVRMGKTVLELRR